MKVEPTVFIVDDDPAFLESFAIFVLSIGFKPQTFSSGIEYVNQFDPHVPGLLILDVRMPVFSGLAVQERLSKQPICPPIVFLTGHADIATTLRAFKLGAFDFLQKPVVESEMREVIQRGVALDADVRREHAKKSEARTLLESLSAPERDVLDLVLTGMPNKNIASKLAVSQRAVEDRRSRLFRKLRVHSLPSLVQFAIDVGRPLQK
jgi:FixJ family two-component response regulator